MLRTRHVETTDLFRGAFYLCMGADLEEIGFRGNGKQIATFQFSGPDLNKHDLDYRNGQALVNPLQFREALNHLRDILFKEVRQSEGRTRNGHRKRKDRGNQKRH